MPRFDHVRLRNGLGWVSAARRIVTPPLDGDSFTIAPDAEPGAVAFHLVETPRWIAVVTSKDAPGRGEVDGELVSLLLRAGCFAVVSLGCEGPGVALAQAWPMADDALLEAGAALWAVKAIAGRDEARVMTFAITGWPEPRSPAERLLGRTTTLSARGVVREVGGQVDVRLPEPGALRAFVARVEEKGGPAACGVAIADVDRMMEFNDAYGHTAGDLAIARIGAALEGLSDDLDAVYMRVGGDEFALLVAEHGRASEVAAAVEGAVAALAIPLAHPDIRTEPWLGVTAVALERPDDLASARPFDAAFDRIASRKGAKRAALGQR